MKSRLRTWPVRLLKSISCKWIKMAKPNYHLAFFNPGFHSAVGLAWNTSLWDFATLSGLSCCIPLSVRTLCIVMVIQSRVGREIELQNSTRSSLCEAGWQTCGWMATATVTGTDSRPSHGQLSKGNIQGLSWILVKNHGIESIIKITQHPL